MFSCASVSLPFSPQQAQGEQVKLLHRVAEEHIYEIQGDGKEPIMPHLESLVPMVTFSSLPKLKPQQKFLTWVLEPDRGPRMGFERSPPALIFGAGHPRCERFKKQCSIVSLGYR